MKHPESDSSENKGLALNRRRFLAYFSSIGLGSTLMPGALLAQAQAQTQGQDAPQITAEMVKGAAIIAGLTFSCLLYTSPSPRDLSTSRMPSSA